MSTGDLIRFYLLFGEPASIWEDIALAIPPLTVGLLLVVIGVDWVWKFVCGKKP